jgi:hypothetical protein
MTRPPVDTTPPLRKQYLHVTAYPCSQCNGPVLAGSMGVRETVVSRETEIRSLQGICLACGTRQDRLPDTSPAREFPPVEWA